MASGTRLDIWNRALGRIGSEPIESETEDRPEAAALVRLYDDLLREVLEARRWPWAMRQRPLTQVGSQSYSWPGDGAQTTFEVPFALLDPSQLEVAHVAGGVATVLTASQYTLAPVAAPPPFATVTLVGIVPEVGESVRIKVTTSRVGWEHLYALPADCVTPVALLAEDQRYELQSEDERDGYAWDRLIDDSGTGFVLACDLDAGDFEVLEYVAYITHVRAFPALFQDALVWRCAAELALEIKKDSKLAGQLLQQYERSVGVAFAKARNNRRPGPDPITPSMRARGALADPRYPRRWPR